MHKSRSTKYITRVTQLSQGNTKYSKWYTNICMRALHRGTIRRTVNSEMGYVELHHIIPKCVEPKFAKECDNVVFVSAREHFLCHYLLCKMFKYTSHYYGLISAFGKMSNCAPSMNQNRYINSRLFALFRKNVSDMAKKLRCGKVRIKKNGVTKEVRADQLSAYETDGWIKGAAATHEATQARVLANKNRSGYIWIKKDQKCFQIQKTELKHYVEMGFQRGRVFSPQGHTNMLNNGSRKRNSISVFNGSATKFINQCELYAHLQSGWQRGRSYKQTYFGGTGSKALVGRLWYNDGTTNYKLLPENAGRLQRGRLLKNRLQHTVDTECPMTATV